MVAPQPGPNAAVSLTLMRIGDGGRPAGVEDGFGAGREKAEPKAISSSRSNGSAATVNSPSLRAMLVSAPDPRNRVTADCADNRVDVQAIALDPAVGVHQPFLRSGDERKAADLDRPNRDDRQRRGRIG